jgi:hypothetical protein
LPDFQAIQFLSYPEWRSHSRSCPSAEKAKLGAEYREAKNKARLQGEALDADWASQLAPGRWVAVTREASMVGASIGFLEAETAKARAINHAFEKHSVINGTRIGISLFGGIYLKEKNLREQIR